MPHDFLRGGIDHTDVFNVDLEEVEAEANRFVIEQDDQNSTMLCVLTLGVCERLNIIIDKLQELIDEPPNPPN